MDRLRKLLNLLSQPVAAEVDVGSKRVLVIDDSEIMLRMLVKALRDAGHECRGTPDLVRFGRHLTEFKPDLVLADVLMPDFYGDDLCRELKARFGDMKAPVYLISSLSENELINRARQAGADGYISKRKGFNQFLEEVEKVLQRTPSRAELAAAERV